MTVGALLQARMGSHRLPGKVLAQLHGQPLLQYLIDRLARCDTLGVVVVATTDRPEDDAVAAFCAQADVECFRGSGENVAGRFVGAATRYGLTAFVRVSGDSPLVDPAFVDRAVDMLLDEECEIATNVFPRTFPPGQSVEALLTTSFVRGYDAMQDPADLEHVTSYFYRHADEFDIHSFMADRDYSGLGFAVDTADDLDRIAGVVGRMERPHWTYGLDELTDLCRATAF